MKIGFIGAGAWGTALANLLASKGFDVTVWDQRTEALDQIRAIHQNNVFLPGVQLDPKIQVQYDPHSVINDSDIVVMAVASSAFRQCAQWLRDYDRCVVSATKGIEYETGLTMSGILRQTAPKAKLAVISGPSFAIEVARRIPTAITAASDDPSTAQMVQDLFRTDYLRVYTNTDTLGVELGGALKNVIAIAAGISDGLGFGDNSKAALVTRALAEMRRIGVAAGARAETFAGLSGLGDLVVTCFSKLSRNRMFGERIGKGETAQAILRDSRATVEGYPTARAAFHLAKKLNVSAPIIEQVHDILYQGKDPRTALYELMTRDPKPED